MKTRPAPRLLALLLLAAPFAGSADDDHRAAYRRPDGVPAPADNATTPDRVALGKMLFFDPRLSGSGAISSVLDHLAGRSGAGDDDKSLGQLSEALAIALRELEVSQTTCRLLTTERDTALAEVSALRRHWLLRAYRRVRRPVVRALGRR